MAPENWDIIRYLVPTIRPVGKLNLIIANPIIIYEAYESGDYLDCNLSLKFQHFVHRIVNFNTSRSLSNNGRPVAVAYGHTYRGLVSILT
jgi:hypothetical protein